jgi:hypothetical protein
MADGPLTATAGTTDAADGLPRERRHNRDVRWDEFEPRAYWHHNYRHLREDDRAIILTVAEYFSGFFDDHPEVLGGKGLDVGSGANLYPALAMLPFTESITLTDHSAANVEWLRQELADTDEDEIWPWQDFWEAYVKSEGFKAYGAVADPQRALARQCEVSQLNVFDLPDQHFDIGTMFFVAESMTSYEREFEDASEHFLKALRPGAPFAAAFMDKSIGYQVGDKMFPAVREVDRSLVASTFTSLGASVTAEKVPIPANDRLRHGYDGMIIATGVTAGRDTTGRLVVPHQARRRRLLDLFRAAVRRR